MQLLRILSNIIIKTSIFLEPLDCDCELHRLLAEFEDVCQANSFSKIKLLTHNDQPELREPSLNKILKNRLTSTMLLLDPGLT